MTIDEHAEMHNKWLQQFGNKMTCMYETRLDNLICAFMDM